MRACLRLAALGFALLPLLAVGAARAEPRTVTASDVLVLPPTRIDGLAISELSGLAYDADEDRLYAISDKARLFHFALVVEGDRIVTLKPLAGHRLTDRAGKPLSASRFNPEGMEVLDAANGRKGDSRLIIASETGPAAALFDTKGRKLADVALPVPLRDTTAQRSLEDGIEAIAHHPAHGLLAAPEEPLKAEPRTRHTVYGTNGRHLTYSSEGIGRSSIKAMHARADGRIVVLERTRSADRLTLVPHLRLIDPAACDTTCNTETVRIAVPGITDADFEGLTEIAPNLFLLVSDDQVNGERRTVFALVRLP
jgi:Esterase-like activity of phytase